MQRFEKVILTITLLSVALLFFVNVFRIIWPIHQSLYKKPIVFHKMQVLNSSKQIQASKNSELLTNNWNSSMKEDVDAFSLSLTSHNFYQVMRRRHDYVKKVCEWQRDHAQSLISNASLSVQGNRNPNEDVRVWLFEKERIAFCPIPKAASTSWKINLLHFRATDKNVSDLIKGLKKA